MRLLFTSDLHASRPAFELFASTLAEGPYEAGVLSGDLLDDLRLPDEFLVEVLGVRPDDLLEDLAAADDAEPWKTASRPFNEINLRGLRAVESRFREILRSSGKPVFLIQGNHDETEWADGDGIVNLHGKRVEFNGWNFVGFRWTAEDALHAEIEAEISELAKLVDRRTVLVTHAPPAGILDAADGRAYGLPSLRRLVRERDPRVHLFGHVHCRHGRRGRFVNGSYPDSQDFWDVDVDCRTARRLPARAPIHDPRWT